MLDCFSLELFCDEKDVPVECYVFESVKCVLYVLPKPGSCESVPQYVWIFVVENLAPLHRNTIVE